MKNRTRVSRRVSAFFMAVVILITMVFPPQNIFADPIEPDPNDQTGSADIIRTAVLGYRVKGAADFVYPEPDGSGNYKIPDSSLIEAYNLKLSFEILDHDDEDALGRPNRNIKPGHYYTVSLPAEISLPDGILGDVVLSDSDKYTDEEIAEYSFVKNDDGVWQVKVVFTDYLDYEDEYEITGGLDFDFTLDLSSVPGGTTKDVVIPVDADTSITIKVTKPIPPDTTPNKIEKVAEKTSYNHTDRELTWTVTMSPRDGDFGGCTFTDTIDTANLTLKSLIHGGKTLVQGEDYEYKDGKITYKIPDGYNGASYREIKVVTTVKSEVYGRIDATTISNAAALKGGQIEGELSSSDTVTITPDWIKKDGTLNGASNKINWTVTANSTRQRLYNGVITDTMGPDLVIDTSTLRLNGVLISNVYGAVPDPLPADNVTYAVLTTDASGSVLKIYLPRGAGNASAAELKITYDTAVVPPSGVTPGVPRYENTVSLEGQYLGDGTGTGNVAHDPDIGIEGVNVPYVRVTKAALALTAADKRNGTITWEFTAISNLASYGRTVITDTLPTGQTYVDGEVYWHNGTEFVKINAGTTPSAVVSGQKLTITFTGPNAVANQQRFRVTTKIDTALYGTNLNDEVFENSVKTQLYDIENEDVVAEGSVTGQVKISNSVIAKANANYAGHTSSDPTNPRTSFTITVNGNLMPLKGVTVSDNLGLIKTEFRKPGASFVTLSGVKWTYVPGTLKIERTGGALDTHLTPAALAAIVTAAQNGYNETDNLLTINFGENVEVNDGYKITFTAELDVSQNPLLAENGTIRISGNKGSIEGIGLKPGLTTTTGTGSKTIENEILSKKGLHVPADQQVVWTMNLNRNRIPESNPRLVDTLPEGLTLDPTSVRLYKNVIGPDGKFYTGDNISSKATPVSSEDFSYSYVLETEGELAGRYTITVSLPGNESDYILVFATDIRTSLLGKEISNVSHYLGEVSSPGNSGSHSFTLGGSAGGSSVNKTFITVYKRSSDNGALLPGARITLYWLNGSEYIPVRTLTTNAYGEVTFYGLSRNQTYALAETGAPENYIIDSSAKTSFLVPGTGSPSSVTFTDSPEKIASWTPSAIKQLAGKGIVRKFNFEILRGGAAVMTGETGTANGSSAPVAFTLTSGTLSDGLLSFKNAHIFAGTDPAGTVHNVADFSLTFREILPDPLPQGYEYDDSEITIRVVVDNVKGSSALRIRLYDGNTLISTDAGAFLSGKTPVFKNSYEASGSVSIPVSKVLTGHALAKDQFEFELYRSGDLETPLYSVKNGADPSPDDGIFSAPVSFPDLVFDETEIGDHTYIIKEKNLGAAGYSYDGATYTVVITVGDEKDNGELSVAIKSITKTPAQGAPAAVSDIVFENSYTTEDYTLPLAGIKSLSGRLIQDGQFRFQVSAIDSDGTVISSFDPVSNAGGAIAFESLVYTQGDIGKTFRYKIFELDDGAKGYEYDETVYILTVEVFDNENGQLRLETALVYEDGGDAEEIGFSNIYTASGSTIIDARKELSGRVLSDGQFYFGILPLDGDGEPAGEPVFVRNDADGNIEFAELAYTEQHAGQSFEYLIFERDDDAPGYEYSKARYIVTVTVTDNGDGTLDVIQELRDADDPQAQPEEIFFENIYTASPVQASIGARKVLDGRVLEEGQFEYVLVLLDDDGEAVGEPMISVNAADGSVSFGPFTYTQEDMGKTFTYRLTETDAGGGGYTYDKAVYFIEIEVRDNGDGTLSAIQTLKSGGENTDALVFTNLYRTSNAIYLPQVSKIVKDAVLKNGQFTFGLVLEGHGLVETVSNNLAGEVRFSALTFTQADIGKTFRYLIAEINDEEPGYIYDESVYVLTILVKDNGDGNLVLEETIEKTSGGATLTAEEIVFENTYDETLIDGGPPRTGYSSTALLYGSVALSSLFGIGVLSLPEKRRRAGKK